MSEFANKETLAKVLLVVSALRKPTVPFIDAGPELPGTVWQDVLQVLKGGRNGAWYGARIRVVHSIVMMILFSNDPLNVKVMKVLNNATSHARNLGTFVLIFKTIMVVLRRWCGKRLNWHSAIAGLLGGSVIWGSSDPIVLQINLYLLSRNLFGAVKLLADNNPSPDEIARNYKVFGSVTWMVVMYMFYNHPLKLQNSLTSSMREIYTDSDIIGRP